MNVVTILIFLLTFVTPNISFAEYSDTVKLLAQVKNIESSSASLLSTNLVLRRGVDSLYQDILTRLRNDLDLMKSPETTFVSFDKITSGINRDSFVTIGFKRTPVESVYPINFGLEDANRRLLGSLSNQVTVNNLRWQVPDKIMTGKDYYIIAVNKDGGLLGRSNVFTVSSATPAVLVAPAVSQPEPDLYKSIIGNWSFDKFSNNCDTKGSASTNLSGKTGVGLTLTGGNSYCMVSANKIFIPKYFTWALWAKNNVSSGTEWQNSGWFVSLRDKAGYSIGPVNGTKEVRFTILDDTPVTQGTYVVGTVTPDDISLWHHFALTYDGVTANAYLDGKLIVTKKIEINRSDAGSADLFFGLDNVAPSAQVGAGSLDEIRLYSRALSPCEIEILAGGICNGVSLSSYSGNLASLFATMKNILTDLRSLIK